ncbi:hypothetical protein, partial [Vibrio anguillarum]|uniref:hypothetical protein n=2 Tax=Vibrio anguillarum TaxID=55601 RepID=UPI0019F3741A
HYGVYEMIEFSNFTRLLTCPCGGFLIGDGYTVVLHCPYTEQPLDVAPDSNPIFCDFEDFPNNA